jgi:hypothetical protein
LRPLENFPELLIRAGFSPADALHAYRLFFGFLHGHILDEIQDLIDNPDEADDLLRLGLHRLPAANSPGYAPWPPNSPATTEPPTSSKAST